MTAARSTPPSPSARILWVLLGVVWVGAFTATHIPPAGLPKTGTGDKVLHAVGYFGLGAVFFAALAASGAGLRRTAALVLVLLTVYGAIDELTQPLVGRSAAWSDWLADVFGAAAAAAVCTLAVVLLRRIGGGGR